MSTIKTKDGVEIFYKDWGKGQPIVFSHGWPLSADDWDTQMLFFLKQGYRVIAHDRRGHGRSTQVSDGHDMDHYADDLAALTAHLDLKNAMHVGHSTGGGEVARYLGRHGESRVAKAALISAVPPLMVAAKVQTNFIDIAPSPPFRRIVAFDDRMAGLAEMLGSVTVWRAVAAADMAARPAEAQMDPRRTKFQTFLASERARRDVANAIEVTASLDHLSLPPCLHAQTIN